MKEYAAALQLEEVNKWYAGGVHAVKNVTMNIRSGEFLVFVGPSGCGKSTTLRMIAGLEKASAGNIWMDEQLINSMPPKKRDMAMVFQNYALYPTMSVFDNLAFPLKMRHWNKTKIQESVKEIADSLEISEYLQRRPGALSGGQRQRVALGRAMVRQPKLFLMDEPLSNLDAKLRVQMRREITSLQRKLGTTTIYVTHDQTEAMTMGSRIAVFNKGELQQIDTPQNVYDKPANLFVAQFIGSPPMNIWQSKDEYLGIRPEHLKWSRTEGDLPACIQTVERTGRETFVFGTAEQIGEFCLITDAFCNLNGGEHGFLTIPSQFVHRFNGTTGKRIDVK